MQEVNLKKLLILLVFVTPSVWATDITAYESLKGKAHFNTYMTGVVAGLLTASAMSKPATVSPVLICPPNGFLKKAGALEKMVDTAVYGIGSIYPKMTVEEVVFHHLRAEYPCRGDR